MPISTVGATTMYILSGLTAWHSPSESPMAPSSTKATERNQAAVCLTMPIACSNWVWILALTIAGPSCNLVDSRRAGAMWNWKRRNKIEKYDKDWQSAFGSPWWGLPAVSQKTGLLKRQKVPGMCLPCLQDHASAQSPHAFILLRRGWSFVAATRWISAQPTKSYQ